MSVGWIGVDLDGTLAYYNGWKGITEIGAPIWPMVERVKQWLREGREVKIFTARVSVKGRDLEPTLWAIRRWSLEHIGEYLDITCTKDLSMIELWDDRVVQVQFNTGEPATNWISRFSAC